MNISEKEINPAWVHAKHWGKALAFPDLITYPGGYLEHQGYNWFGVS